MKMEPKVTSASSSLLPLLLLSTITAVGPYYTGVLSRSISNQIRSPLEDCEKIDAINVWFSKQIMLSYVLEQNILYLDRLLNETSAFYEKDAMQLIFQNVEEINRLNGTQIGEFPKWSGELGKDLNEILPWIKKLVPKGFKDGNCCKELENSLIETKKRLEDKWEEVKNEISEEIGKGNVKIKEELQEKQGTLWDQLEDIKKQLINIQQDKDNIVSNSDTKCCSKFEKKIKSLQNQLNVDKDEANDNTQEFEEKLKKINDRLKNQDKKANDAIETLEKRVKNIKETLEKYKKNDNEQLEKQSNDLPCPKGEMEKEIERLEERVKELADMIASFSKNVNETLCLANGQKLAKIESRLETILVDINIKKKEVFVSIESKNISSGNMESGNGSSGNTSDSGNMESGNGSSKNVSDSGNGSSEIKVSGNESSGNVSDSGNGTSGNMESGNGSSKNVSDSGNGSSEIIVSGNGSSGNVSDSGNGTSGNMESGNGSSKNVSDSGNGGSGNMESGNGSSGNVSDSGNGGSGNMESGNKSSKNVTDSGNGSSEIIVSGNGSFGNGSSGNIESGNVSSKNVSDSGNGSSEIIASGNGSSGNVSDSGNGTSGNMESGNGSSKNVSDSGNGSSGSAGAGNEGSGTNNQDCLSDKTLEDRVKNLQQEVEQLRENLTKSQTCTEKIPELYAMGDKFLKSIENMNQTYDDHIMSCALDVEEIKKDLKKGEDKLRALESNRKNPEEGSRNETGEDFQNQLWNLQTGLEKAKEDFKNLHNKLNELPTIKDKPTNLDIDKLSDTLKEQMNKFNENWIKADKRLRLLEERAMNKSLGEKRTRLDRMKELLESLRRDMNKSENEILRLEQPEKLHNAHMDKLNKLENAISPCRDSCKDLGKMDDLIDNIEDTEKFFKTNIGQKVAIKPPKPVKKVNKKPDNDKALIGGIDFVEQGGMKNG